MSELRPGARPGVWTFETAEMRGELTADAATQRHGVTSLAQLSTGREIVQEGLFCLHLYRVLVRNQWLSQCRDVPHTGTLEGDELVVRWPAEALGPGLEAEARYRVSSASSIDLTVSLSCSGRWHRAFELYTSNYFDHSLAPGLYTRTPFGGPDAVMTRPGDTDATRHCYHVWPRDTLGAQGFTDGRWEYGTHSPIPWAICRWHAYPLGFYATADHRTAAVVMARPEDCFAMCTSYHSDDPNDFVAHHNSLYHNLIGKDVGPGWQRTLRQRLTLIDWSRDDAVLQAYEAF